MVAPFFSNQFFFWCASLLIFLMALSIVGVVFRNFSFLHTFFQTTPKFSFRLKVLRFFSALVATPITILTIFSVIFLYFGLNAWFNNTVQSAIREAQKIASAYLKEHQQTLKSHIRELKNDLQQTFHEANLAPIEIKKQKNNFIDDLLTIQTRLRKLDEALLFCTNGSIIGRSQFSFGLEFQRINAPHLARASDKIVIYPNKQRTRFLAITKLHLPGEIYLIASRKVNPQILKKISVTTEASKTYEKILQERHLYTTYFILLFLIIVLAVLFITMWKGLLFADIISMPVQALMNAATKIQNGFYNTRCRIPEKYQKIHEIRQLITTFNHMTQEVDHQQKTLKKVHFELQKKHLFTKNVLSAISSGVIALNRDGEIILINAHALTLLEASLSTLKGKKLKLISPDLWECFLNSKEQQEHQINFLTKKGIIKTFRVRIKGTEQKNQDFLEPVMTFEDITLFVVSERQAAWADLAKRVAHEIKNPLTPIQLSAERLQKRYLPQITENPEIFKQCIQTIQRQVNNLVLILEEFLSFARLPKPEKKSVDLEKLIQREVKFHQEIYPNIEWTLDAHPIFLCIDEQQISQVLINIFKNSVEGISPFKPRETGNPYFSSGNPTRCSDQNF